MQYTESEVTEFITDNDVKFIKMAFCDIFGRQKIIAIQPVSYTHLTLPTKRIV